MADDNPALYLDEDQRGRIGDLMAVTAEWAGNGCNPDTGVQVGRMWEGLIVEIATEHEVEHFGCVPPGPVVADAELEALTATLLPERDFTRDETVGELLRRLLSELRGLRAAAEPVARRSAAIEAAGRQLRTGGGFFKVEPPDPGAMIAVADYILGEGDPPTSSDERYAVAYLRNVLDTRGVVTFGLDPSELVQAVALALDNRAPTSPPT